MSKKDPSKFNLAIFLLLLFVLAASFFLVHKGVGMAASLPEVYDLKKAEGIYLKWCAQCHGVKGKGDGVNSTRDMAINPRDHTDALFMVTRTDEQFKEVVSDGGAGVAKSPLMPPWSATLTEEEIDSLIGYLRKLCDCEFEGVVSHGKLRRVDTDFR